MDEEKSLAAFRKLDDRVVQFFRFFAHLSGLALITIMLLCVIDIIGVKLAAAGVSWAHGISNNNAMVQYFHIPLVFLASACVTLDQGHTRIDLLCSKLPQSVEKAFILFGHVLGIVFSFVIAYRSIVVTLADQIQKHTRIASTTSAWPAWPFTIMHILGFTLLGLSFVWGFVRTIRFWKYPKMNPYYILHPEKEQGIGEITEQEENGGEEIL